MNKNQIDIVAHSLGINYYNAKYQEGLAYAESNQLDRSLQTFEQLIQSRAGAPVTDKSKVAGMMGKAREAARALGLGFSGTAGRFRPRAESSLSADRLIEDLCGC